MWRLLLDLVSSLFLGLSALLLCSPVLLVWWIHGDYKRYVWIISGPFPYDNFGGGPFQLFMYVGLFAGGIVLVALSLPLRALLRRG